MDHTSRSFAVTVDALRDVATNPQVKNNLLDTTRSFAVTAKTFAELANDLRQVTGNPQTQSQLRDTVAQLDAASQKANSILAQFGGKSSVYGVDAGATPYPGGSPSASAPSTAPERATRSQTMRAPAVFRSSIARPGRPPTIA